MVSFASCRAPRFASVSDRDEFTDFLLRVRAGDSSAAAELVHRYERAVRVVVRIRLTDPDLRRQFDSLDVCQSVLASFFVRVAAGQFDLHEPRDLVALLARMAEHKLHRRVRHWKQLKRDQKRTAHSDDLNLDHLGGDEPGPEQIAIGHDLFDTLRARLSPEERQLAERRAAGLSWPEIAEQLGGTAQARRRQLTRAVNRIAPQLGIDDGADDE